MARQTRGVLAEQIEYGEVNTGSDVYVLQRLFAESMGCKRKYVYQLQKAPDISYFLTGVTALHLDENIPIVIITRHFDLYPGLIMKRTYFVGIAID